MNPVVSLFPQRVPVPLQQIHEPLFDRFGVQVFIQREDLVHPVISGNKWYKLKYNIIEAVEQNYRTVISFGGAFSNHIHALAYAGKWAGLQTIGVIRGESHEPLNATLQFAVDQGMTLHYVDRMTYRLKTSDAFINRLIGQYGPSYVVPEGGSNSLAVKGCSEIVQRLPIPFDVICCACGTGGTLAGLIHGLDDKQRAIGFSTLKGGEFLIENVQTLLAAWPRSPMPSWEIKCDYHFGGYAKVTSELMSFAEAFEA
jgi:1-aminocyclopropane-1-carboxylate deaminase